MIFKIGSRGNQVQDIQEALLARGYELGVADGIFGNATRRAVTKYQIENDLNGDGVVGPLTWQKLLPSSIPSIPELRVPDNREEVFDIFGDPLEASYWKRYGAFCTVPPELSHVFPYQRQGNHGFWCNRLLVPVFEKVYDRIVKDSLSSELYSFDGCYNLRNVRGGDKLSMHSWGIAVDHNAKTNRLGTKGDLSPKIVKIFEEEEFTWGGRFGRKDPMHFEFTKRGL